MLRTLLPLTLAVLTVAPAWSQTVLPVSNTDLIRDHLYLSPSGDHFLIFRPDGDLVVLDTDGAVVWGLAGSGVPVQDAARVVVLPDGNLAVYATDGRSIWSALTTDLKPGAVLTVSADGDLQLVADGGPVWSARQGAIGTTARRTIPLPMGGGAACDPAVSGAGGDIEGDAAPAWIEGTACLERIAHEGANRARTDRGLGAVEWSDVLASTARTHSEDVIQTGLFSHASADGRKPLDRIRASGFECEQGYGENIARTPAAVAWGSRWANGQSVETTTWASRDEVGGGPVAQWLDSPGHRANLLEEKAWVQGIGFAYNPETQEYIVTQVLCHR